MQAMDLAVGDREPQGLVETYLGSREGPEPISREELLARLEAGEPLVVVDVRTVEVYWAAHLPGAVSIRLELEQRLRELPQESQIVAYCRGPYCALRRSRDHGSTRRSGSLAVALATSARAQAGSTRHPGGVPPNIPLPSAHRRPPGARPPRAGPVTPRG